VFKQIIFKERLDENINVIGGRVVNVASSEM
jgi:hypothetical protein